MNAKMSLTTKILGMAALGGSLLIGSALVSLGQDAGRIADRDGDDSTLPAPPEASDGGPDDRSGPQDNGGRRRERRSDMGRDRQDRDMNDAPPGPPPGGPMNGGPMAGRGPGDNDRDFDNRDGGRRGPRDRRGPGGGDAFGGPGGPRGFGLADRADPRRLIRITRAMRFSMLIARLASN
jgi:hypothetical protein